MQKQLHNKNINFFFFYSFLFYTFVDFLIYVFKNIFMFFSAHWTAFSASINLYCTRISSPKPAPWFTRFPVTTSDGAVRNFHKLMEYFTQVLRNMPNYSLFQHNSNCKLAMLIFIFWLQTKIFITNFGCPFLHVKVVSSEKII